MTVATLDTTTRLYASNSADNAVVVRIQGYVDETHALQCHLARLALIDDDFTTLVGNSIDALNAPAAFARFTRTLTLRLSPLPSTRGLT